MGEPNTSTFIVEIEFDRPVSNRSQARYIRASLLTAGQIASEIATALDGYAIRSQEVDEEDFCTCGAGHGSGEEHEEFCHWPKLKGRLYPPARQRRNSVRARSP